MWVAYRAPRALSRAVLHRRPLRPQRMSLPNVFRVSNVMLCSAGFSTSVAPDVEGTETGPPTSPFPVGSVGAAKLMSSLAVAIPAKAEDVEVLASPADFYAKLLELSAQAERHVSLSSLYLGTDGMEQALVDTLVRRCEEKPELEVHVTLDYQRGIRPVGDKSSVTMLRPLLECSRDLVLVPRTVLRFSALLHSQGPRSRDPWRPPHQTIHIRRQRHHKRC
jgi:hypothetical protein